MEWVKFQAKDGSLTSDHGHDPQGDHTPVKDHAHDKGEIACGTPHHGDRRRDGLGEMDFSLQHPWFVK